ncbi:hypothetical protein OG986_33475 [Streptomyces cellulosae]|uniref:hypothetical protein n=1 Tax=unclassified Streptomyces TaxID=2593676 RepID=UPI00048F3659
MATDTGGTGESNLQRWSLIVSTASAGLGLILTAIVTWFGVLTAQDQLDQSREDADKEVRQQASRVTSWVLPGENGKKVQVIANRTLEPILGMVFYYPVGVDTQNGSISMVAQRLGQIPPCTSVLTEIPERNSFHGFTFVDSSGRGWTRDSDGNLVESDVTGYDKSAPLVDYVKTEALTGCK